MVLIYPSDGINEYGSRGREIEGIGSVQGVENLKVAKSYSYEALPIRLFRHYCCVTSKNYQADLMFVMKNCFLLCVIGLTNNHCLHHLLPSERDTGHDLRRRGRSYQLVCYNFSSTRRCFDSYVV